MMACFLLKYLPMADATRIHLVAKALRLMTILMLATAMNTGCPIPVQYPLEPDAGNQPLVVNSKYTSPYIGNLDVVEGQTPIFTIVVDDPNGNDDISVKVIKDPHLTWTPDTDSPKTLLVDYEISPLDTLSPEDASNMAVSDTTRRAFPELSETPCPVGTAGDEVFIWVCLTDRSWQTPPPGYPNEDPCIPRDGFADYYGVIVTCILP